jgi:hypothetical protein
LTVIGATPTSLAIRVFAKPSEAINRTRALDVTMRCGVRTDQLLQHRSLLVGDWERGGR